MSDIEEIEVSLEEAKETAALGDCLERLTKNPDFNRLIMVGYLEKEAVRTVLARSNPGMQTPERQTALNRCMDGIGELYQYFTRIDRAADQALMAIADLEETRSEMAEQGEL
jgi:hypothetical protein